jgi:MYXO-CTERM domain-containing protein
MLIPRTLVFLCATCFAVAATCSGSMIAVDSSNDGGGLFSYVVTRGADPYLFGGMSSSLFIRVPSYGVVDTFDPPGWQSITTDPHTVTWQYLGTWVLDNETVTCQLQSVSSSGITYDQLDPAASYPQGYVMGDVYDTNHQLYTSSGGGDVTSINIVGYERFSFTGPVIPEPALALLGLLALAVFRRR